MDRVAEEVFDHAIKPEYLQAFLATPNNVLIVAMEDGVVVGMVTGIAYVHPDKPLSLFINELGVSAHHRGRGIGKRLMRAILDWGRECGCLEAWVATEEANAAARSVYRASGGTEDADRAVVYTYDLRDRGTME